jgi:hypothetical protein
LERIPAQLSRDIGLQLIILLLTLSQKVKEAKIGNKNQIFNSWSFDFGA